ncbi:MAG: AbrB family looped-hinge helix DNA binding protein [Candidatus Omnitrophota bacterium]|jgi:AbrB family looped-hinge helix DNA binding protein
MNKPQITKLSSRGQMVIPQSLRNQLGLEEGQQFVVIGEGDTLIFKRMEMPTMDKMQKMLKVS